MPFDGHIHVPYGSSRGEVRNVGTTAAQLNNMGGLPLMFVVPIAAGAAANVDLTVPQKVRIIDAWAVHTGGAGEASDTLQVFNGTHAITDAMDWSGSDKAIVRAGEIDDAYHEIAAGGTLRATTTDADVGTDVGAGVLYVLAIPVA